MANTRQSIVIEKEDAEMFEEKEVWSDPENDIEYNQELVDSLDHWEKEKVVLIKRKRRINSGICRLQASRP